MNKVLALIFMNMILLSAISYAEEKSAVKVLDSMLKSEIYSRSLVQQYKDIPISLFKNESQLLLFYETSLFLSWFVQDKQMFKEAVFKIEKLSPTSDSLNFKTSDAFLDRCSGCKGTGIGKVDCSSCKGDGKCTNYLCNEGKVKVKDKEFGEILVDCSICFGGDNCRKCKGDGKVPGVCLLCRKKGLAFSRLKVKSLLNEKLESLKSVVIKIQHDVFVQAQKGKGLVEVDGKWLTKEKWQNLEAEKMKNENAAKLEKQMEADNFAKLRANSLLIKLQSIFEKDSLSAAAQVAEIQKAYPHLKLNIDLSRKLQYLQLLKNADEYQAKGIVSKAISALQRALELEESEALKKRIEQLDEQTIGL